jgi:hypothetical protein
LLRRGTSRHRSTLGTCWRPARHGSILEEELERMEPAGLTGIESTDRIVALDDSVLQLNLDRPVAWGLIGNTLLSGASIVHAREMGFHRHLRQDQRRRLPDRFLSGGQKGDLGLPGHLCQLASHPRRQVRGTHIPRIDRRISGIVDTPTPVARWPSRPRSSISTSGHPPPARAERSVARLPPRRRGGRP